MKLPAHPALRIATVIARAAAVLGSAIVSTPGGQAQRIVEHLDRGVIAVRSGTSEAFVSWRMLGTDPADIAFNLYRATDGAPNPLLLNSTPLTAGTNFVDTTADFTKSNDYTVRAVLNGTEQSTADTWQLPANAPVQQFLNVPLQRPPGGTAPGNSNYTYTPNDCSVGDLDGDGDYELVVKWDPTNARDNSQSGYTGNVYLDAYELDGTLLWRIDLGRNIRAGAHYTQLMVYDLDSDGRAEVACKTAPGTIDGVGNNVLLAGHDANADYRNFEGYVLSGPEYLTVFDGLTGANLATTEYVPVRGSVASWGDSYGNRVDRFLACVAYLDGTRPSLVMCRGYYTRTVLTAWDWRGGQLTQRWVFDSDDGTPGNFEYRGEGNHNLSVADVDADGRDEIIYGSCAIDDDGTGLYETDLRHGDAMHVSDLLPSRPGLEVWACLEDVNYNGNIGLTLRDARTGEILFTVSNNTDTGRAVAIDIDPRHPGYEMWGSAGSLNTATGEVIGARPSSVNFAVWWDGDLLREILDSNRIDKWNWESGTTTRLLTATDCVSNNGTKSTPALSADLFGDWREEVIWRTSDNENLRIYTTTIPTEHRIPTLMHDPQYRLAIAWQNVAYNQPPHPGFFLGHGMNPPPTPDIVTTATTVEGSRLSNLSVRTTGGTGTDTLILGFVVDGSTSQEVLLRGIGPALEEYGVAGVMTDPRLDLHRQIGDTDITVAGNDDWAESTDAAAIESAAAMVGAFELPEAGRDAAMLRSLSPGQYTAQVTPATGAGGVALAEVYALNPGGNVRLVNASARARAGTNDETLIAGFVIGGTEPKTILVRAIGPTLGGFGVSGSLPDPQLEVYRQLPAGGSERVAGNDDWAFVSGASAATFERLGAFPLELDSKDAALLLRLSPGSYTAHASGAAGTTGTALIEVYEVAPE